MPVYIYILYIYIYIPVYIYNYIIATQIGIPLLVPTKTNKHTVHGL